MPKNRSKILIVAADHNLRTLLELAFSHNGFLVFLAPSTHSALLQIGVLHPDLIILDALLPDINLAQTAGAAQELYESPVLLLASPDDRILSSLDKKENKITAWAPKPLRIQELYDQVHYLLNNKSNSAQEIPLTAI